MTLLKSKKMLIAKKTIFSCGCVIEVNKNKESLLACRYHTEKGKGNRPILTVNLK